MSWCAESRIARAAALGLAMAAAHAAAAPEGKALVAPPAEGAPPAFNRKAPPEQPVLRCWQYGRLVFEKAGVRPAEIPLGAQVFRRGDRDDQPIYVFDMTNGMCVVSHEAVAAEPPANSR